ncbi:nickel/cobalt transporter [Dongia sp.]|uniref:nickel/cobalt transporter n=1 Tax=Dongia sp. TaxID=1977262 RepID=UPI0035B2D715
MKLLGILLAMLLFFSVEAVRAEETAQPVSPFGTGAAANESTDAGSPSAIVFIGRTFVTWQRDVNRAINQRLLAIKRGDDNTAIWAGIGIAFLYGVFHALGPGHGKTVVIGYFLGRHARPWRGVVMAAWIAASHVVGAIAIVGIAHLLLSRSLVSPTNEFFWLRAGSYLAIIVIGLLMLRDWMRGGHAHAHAHDCSGEHHHAHAGDHVCQAGNNEWLDRRAPIEQRLLALAAGLVPCSGAILILLFTLGNGLIFAGLLMSAAIAVGMGLTLAGLGVASILLRQQVSLRLPEGGRTQHWLALTGPVLVLMIGLCLLGLTLISRLVW